MSRNFFIKTNFRGKKKEGKISLIDYRNKAHPCCYIFKPISNVLLHIVY